MEEQFSGRPVPRKEAREKVTGQSRYVDDLRFPGTWFGATVRSECARGRIRGVTFGEGIPWKELTIVTARDIPGENPLALIQHDHPLPAYATSNHPQHPV